MNEEKVMQILRIKRNMKNNENVRRVCFIVFLGAIGFGAVYRNIESMILGVVLFIMVTNMNTVIRIDSLRAELIKK